MDTRPLITILAAAVISMASVLWLRGVFERSQVQRINGSESQRIVFRTSDESPSGVSLRVRGHIDGTATITTLGWRPQQLSGDVDWSVYHDWFQSTCTFDYTPTPVASGKLTIELTFH